jgi:hypothetical protein
VDHWTAGGAWAARAEIPISLGSGPPADPGRLVLVRSESEAYLGGGSDLVAGGAASFARYDGARWTPIEAPVDTALRGYDVTPEGELWAVFDGPRGAPPRTLWRRPRSAAAWERVGLDGRGLRADIAGVDPMDVLARGPDDVWTLVHIDYVGGT